MLFVIKKYSYLKVIINYGNFIKFSIIMEYTNNGDLF